MPYWPGATLDSVTAQSSFPVPSAGGRSSPPASSYRLAFYPGEELGMAVHRILVSELDLIIDALRSWSDRDDAVHRTRQALKRSRAIIRLIRDEVGHYRYRQVNAVLRDAGRHLSEVRSAVVHEQLIRSLAAEHSALLRESEWADLLRVAHEQRRRAYVTVVEDRRAMTDLLTAMLSLRARILCYPTTEPLLARSGTLLRPIRNDAAIVFHGLHRVYRRGQRAMRRAAKTRSTHDLHRWRKRAKYLRHQIEALSSASPEALESTAATLERLSDRLGDEHDLAEVQMLIDNHADVMSPESRAGLNRVIAAHRARLQEESIEIGAQFFIDSPDAFAARVAALVTTLLAD